MVDEEVKQEITEEAEEMQETPKKRMSMPLMIVVGVSAGLLGAMAMFLVVGGGPESSAEAAPVQEEQTQEGWIAKHEPWTMLTIGEYEFSLGKNKPQISASLSLQVEITFVEAIGGKMATLKMEVEKFFRDLVAGSQSDLLDGDFNKAWNELESRLYEGLITGRNPITDEKIKNEANIFPFNKKNLKAVHIGGLDSSPMY